MKTVKPNPAHSALGELQKALQAKNAKLTVITQNVDDLHERGGVKGVIHVHGILTALKCQFCEFRWEWKEDAQADMTCPNCYVRTGPRPDIVWFGEMPYHLEEIETLMKSADLFVSIGTSGHVSPAAGLVSQAKAWGINTLELNLETSQTSSLFDESRRGKAGTIVPQWVSEIISD